MAHCGNRHRSRQRHGIGATLIELVIVLVVGAILFAVTPLLVWHGVKVMVFLPRHLAVNQAAQEAMQQIVEGGWSTLAGRTTPIRGLRFAVRTLPTGGSGVQPALWLAETNRIGFLTADGDYVLLRLQSEAIKRSLPPTTQSCSTINTWLASVPPEEILPYQAASVRILAPAAVFRYYNQSGTEIVTPGCPPNVAIRRIDIAFTAQTGNGVFDEGQAQQAMTSSAAIRIP